MKEIIKKAIEGGWKPGLSFYTKDEHLDFALNDYEKPSNGDMVVDSLFWQAIGKACGWDKEIREDCCSVCGEPMTAEDGRMFKFHGYVRDCPKPPLIINEWKKKALRFYEINLTSGWDKAIEYLLSVIK